MHETRYINRRLYLFLNDVRTAIQQFYPPQKNFYTPKQISGYAPAVLFRSMDVADKSNGDPKKNVM